MNYSVSKLIQLRVRIAGLIHFRATPHHIVTDGQTQIIKQHLCVAASGRCAVTCPRCKRKNAATQRYCGGGGADLCPVATGELSSGSSVAIGPRFFVDQTTTAGSEGNNYATRRRRPGMQRSPALLVLLLAATFVWLVLDTAVPIPDSRPIIAVHKMIKNFQTEETKKRAPATRAAFAPQLNAAVDPTTTANVDTVNRMTTAVQSQWGKGLQSENDPIGETHWPPKQTQPQEASVRAAARAPLESAVDKSDPDSPIKLADTYLASEGVPRSCEQALALLRTAASKASLRARNRLAAMYAIGSCVQRDRVEAYRWLTLSLALSPNDTWALRNRALTWRQMTDEERKMAEATQ